MSSQALGKYGKAAIEICAELSSDWVFPANFRTAVLKGIERPK
jgi:hypothetical protein